MEQKIRSRVKPMKPSSPLYILWLLVLCAGVVACTDREAMQERLAYVSACNRADTVFTARWVPTVDSLVEFFDRHGSPNDRMMAHYLQGRVHHDMGEAPRAVDCYQQAVDCADTLASDCDYYTLAAVYGQMGELFHKQNLPLSEISARKKYRDYALLIQDTLDYVNGIVQMVKPYYLLDEKDSVLQILDDAYQMYIDLGYRSYAAGILLPSVYINVERGDFSEAERLLHIFEQESGLFDSTGNIAKGREHYYCTKGIYCLEMGQIDSADLYFRKSIRYGYHLDAYRGLLSVYREQKNADSIAKYSLLYEDAIDNNNQQIQTTSVQLATSLYNYNRTQKIAEQNAQKAAENRREFYVSVFLLAVSFIFIVFIVRYARHRRKEQERELAATIAERARLQSELQHLKNANYETIIAQKEKEIEQLNNALAEKSTIYNKMISNNKLSDFKESKIAQLIIGKTEFKLGDVLPTSKEWNDLLEQFRKDMPSLYSLMKDNCALSVMELRTCILLIMGISESDIASILNTKPQTINTAKIRANKKLFKAKDSASLKNNLKQFFVS